MQACGREKECIQLYKNVERSHPAKKVRKQAADLRFILEAPRLTVSPDERVQVPLLSKAVRCGASQPTLQPLRFHLHQCMVLYDISAASVQWQGHSSPAGLLHLSSPQPGVQV